VENFVVGKNAVLQLLRNNHKVNQLLISRSSKKDERVAIIIELAMENKVPYRLVELEELDQRCKNVKHQGVLAFVPKRQFADVEDILNEAKSRNEEPFIIILDNIEDPHNFGSIIRTAVAGGVHGIVISKNKQVDVTPVVAKVSTGAINQILIAKVANIVQAIELLKKNNVWIFGADMNTDTSYCEQDYQQGTAVVIGNEGKGISRLVKEKCDFLINIPISSSIDSLNAGVSAGIIIFKIKEKREIGNVH
jgi:23S rRNA (guanosine2251-2'-O)-methyltransferase